MSKKEVTRREFLKKVGAVVVAAGLVACTPEGSATKEATATKQPTATPEATATKQPTATKEATATKQPTATPEATATAIPEIRKEFPVESVVVDVKRIVKYGGKAENEVESGKGVRYGHVVLITLDEMISHEKGMAVPTFEHFPPEFDTDNDPFTKSAETMINEATDRMFSHAHAEQNGIVHENYWEADDYYNDIFSPLLENARVNNLPLMVKMSDGFLECDATKDVEIIFVRGEGPIELFRALGFGYQRREDDLGAMIYVYSEQPYYSDFLFSLALNATWGLMLGGSRNLRMQGGTFASSGKATKPETNPYIDILYALMGVNEGPFLVDKPLALVANLR